MNKIVGFTISKYEINHDDIDYLKSGLKLLEFKKNGYFIYFWGINNIIDCKVDEKFTLSFPISDNLLDRNVLVYFDGEDIFVENDWLGSIPIFYNESNVIVSTLSLKTLTYKEIHPEGLANFVEFGYSILEQTPFKEVKFMRYYSRLVINKDGITIQYKEDPVLKTDLFNNKSDEVTVFNKIKKYVSEVEAKTNDEIILPTSGGYDSRLLNICVDDKSRIRSYTYGISDDQSLSFEVVHAKKISEILGTQWEQIKLGEFDQYICDWFNLFGVSTHLHGMYHIEFYKKILEKHKFKEKATFLSGIVGDAWAGKVNVGAIDNFNEVTKLAYSHGANADIRQLLVQYNYALRNNFFYEHEKYLGNEKVRIVFLIRFKIILISYLVIVPEYFGFPVWTPYLNFNIVVEMLNLPEERRLDRAWQKDIFKKYSLDLESMNLTKDYSNSLNYQAYINDEFEPLDIQLMSKYFSEEYLEKINYVMSKKSIPLLDNLLTWVNKELMCNRYIGYGLRSLGIKDKRGQNILIVYPYYIIKTIELSLKSEYNYAIPHNHKNHSDPFTNSIRHL